MSNEYNYVQISYILQNSTSLVQLAKLVHWSPVSKVRVCVLLSNNISRKTHSLALFADFKKTMFQDYLTLLRKVKWLPCLAMQVEVTILLIGL